MASMGFSHMSSGRQFKANLDGTLRQLDSVAVDEESVVVVECTQADEPDTPKSMRPLVEKVASWRNGKRAYSLFKTHFHNRDLQVAFVIATRRIEWSRNDLDRAQDHKIVVIRDDQIDYFARLVSHLKYAARYQFLASRVSRQGGAGIKAERTGDEGSDRQQNVLQLFGSTGRLVEDFLCQSQGQCQPRINGDLSEARHTETLETNRKVYR